MAKQYILLNGNVRQLKDGANRSEVIARLTSEGKDAKPCNAPPSLKTLEKYSSDSVCKATDGCKVEPDGICQHGHKSWLLQLGFV